MNRSFQGLLILGPVPRGLCIHEGQERHHEVTGGDSVKVTSSCRPLVLSQQAASSRAPVPPPHHSLKTSPCCGERPLGPSPWPSLDTSSATGTSVRKDTTAGFPRLPPPAPDHLVASPQRPLSPPSGRPILCLHNLGESRAARTIRHTGILALPLALSAPSPLPRAPELGGLLGSSPLFAVRPHCCSRLRRESRDTPPPPLPPAGSRKD